MGFIDIFRLFRRRRKKQPLKYLHKELAAAEAGWEHLINRLPHFAKDYQERTKLLTWAKTTLYKEIVHYFVEIEVIITQERDLAKTKERLEVLLDEISDYGEKLHDLTEALPARRELNTPQRWKKKVLEFAFKQIEVLEDTIEEFIENIEKELEKTH